jgi:hypothetical protein
LNAALFTANTVTEENVMPYAFLISLGETYVGKRPSRQHAVLVLSTANVMATALPAFAFLNETDSREKVKKAIVNLLCRETRNNTFYNLELQYTALKSKVATLTVNFAEIGADLADNLNSNANLTYLNAIDILKSMVDSGTHRLKAISTYMYINLFTALGKKGSITERKADSLNK